MNNIINIHDIALVIQLAVAPVFLLTGIAGFLSVLSNRLGRITDRARILERRLLNSTGEHQKEQHNTQHKELRSLWRRVKMINTAIRLCTTSALLVSMVVIVLFLADILRFNLSSVVALLFILAMLLLVIGLIFFLREVTSATTTMRMGMEFVVDEAAD